MKVEVLWSVSPNTGKLEPQWKHYNHVDKDSGKPQPREEDYFHIKKGRFEQMGESNPLRSGDERYFKRIQCLEYKNRAIYAFYPYAKIDKNNVFHVGFNWWQHQRFLWMQGDHWFQKEGNIRYVINLIFLSLGLWVGYQNIN